MEGADIAKGLGIIKIERNKKFFKMRRCLMNFDSKFIGYVIHYALIDLTINTKEIEIKGVYGEAEVLVGNQQWL